MNESAMQLFQPKDMGEAMKFADVLSRSGLLPEPLRGKPGDVLVTIITGQELGLTAMQAIRGMHVVKGKAIMSADLAVAIVKRHADCVFFRMVESSDKVATYETERKGEGKTQMSFTIAQAQQAGIAGGDNWRKYPAAMLRARASAALARSVYPDLMLGVYEEDEGKEVGGKAERDVTPTVRGADAVRAALAPKPALVVDVKADETEEDAAKRNALPVNVRPFESWDSGKLNARLDELRTWLEKAPAKNKHRDKAQMDMAEIEAELALRSRQSDAAPFDEPPADVLLPGQDGYGATP